MARMINPKVSDSTAIDADVMAALKNLRAKKGTGIMSGVAELENEGIMLSETNGVSPDGVALDESESPLETDGVEEPTPSQSLKADDTEGWREMLSEPQKQRLVTIEKRLKDETEKVTSAGKRIKELEKIRDGVPVKDRKPYQQAIDSQERQLKPAQRKVEATQKLFDNIKESGEKRFAAKTPKTERSLVRQRDAQAGNLIPKESKFYNRPLTGEESIKLADYLDRMHTNWGIAQKAEGEFFKDAIAIYNEGLYVGYEGGYPALMEAEFEIGKAHAYRLRLAGEQFNVFNKLLALPITHLDKDGNPEKVKLDASQLPAKEGHLRALRELLPGDEPAQLKVWTRVVEESQATNKPITAKTITDTGRNLVRTGVVATGLDKQVEEKASKAPKPKRLTLLNFNYWIQRAKFKGRQFDVANYNRADDANVYEVWIDGKPMEDGSKEGKPMQFFSREKAEDAANAEAAKIPDDWTDSAPAPTKANGSAPAATAVATKATAKAKAGTPVAKAESPNVPVAGGSDRSKETPVAPEMKWWFGLDEDGDVTYFQTTGTPDLDTSGFESVNGPHDTKKAAVIEYESSSE